jgi:hypothetical protein
MCDLIARRVSDGKFFERFYAGSPVWTSDRHAAKIVDEVIDSLIIKVIECVYDIELVDTDFDDNGFVGGAAPLCVFCGAKWTNEMIDVYDIDASHGPGSYDFGPEDQHATLDITCGSCGRLIYRKEHRAD